MALKNPGIATANPQVAANAAYINALYKEVYGRPATQAELNKFVGQKVANAANLIMGKSSPFFNYKPPVATPTPTPTPAQSPAAQPAPAYQPIIDAIVNTYKQTQPATPPTFDSTGLYNEAQAQSLAEAEFNPFFDKQKTDYLTELNRQRDYTNQDYSKALNQNINQLSSNYENRGLLRSGGYEANRNYVTQENQSALNRVLTGYDTQQNKTLEQLQQERLNAIAGYKNNAYQTAWQKYISQINR